MWEILIAAYNSISWNATAGIVFGASISALVSYLLQRNQFREVRRQRDADRIEERKAVALNVLTKMMRIASTLEILQLSIEGAFRRAERDGLKGPPWTFVIPIANLPGKVHFEPNELTEVMRLDFQLFNDLGPFDDVHNVLLDTFAMYRTDRNALTENMSAEMKGNLGTTSFTAEEMKRLAPKMAALDTLVVGMIERTTKDSAEAWQILTRLQVALNKQFNLKLQLERKEPVHQT
ncbi:MAG: hypothetical protein FJX62_22360 [Alphaproteobacteria bacterium]|nr:hypothetical protein [Alphaproteobacteria bacterium]